MPQEFAVVEMASNTAYEALVGRPWLYDTRIVQDWGDKTFTLKGKGKTVRFPLVIHGPRAENIMDDPEALSSTTTSNHETASSYSENAYRTLHDPLIITSEECHEPDNGGILNIASEVATSEYMYSWLQEAYETSGTRTCYKMAMEYDEDIQALEDSITEIKDSESEDDMEEFDHTIVNNNLSLSLQLTQTIQTFSQFSNS